MSHAALGDQFKYVVDVGFAMERPPVERHTSRVHLMADSDHQAHLTALQMVAGRPGVVMPTSSRIHEVEL